MLSFGNAGRAASVPAPIADYGEFPPAETAFGIAAGPDGNVWFTQPLVKRVGKITTAGVVTTYAVPTPPGGIIAGPDGNLWVTLPEASTIARITPSGSISTFALGRAGLMDIFRGPDNDVWFVEWPPLRLGRIASSGHVRERELPSVTEAFSFFGRPGADPGVAVGPDGNLWFGDSLGNKILQLAVDGTLKSFPLPKSNDTHAFAFGGIVAGPDGNLWFTEQAAKKIGRMSVTGAVIEYSLPTPNSVPLWIAVGPDKNLWFTESGGKIGRITPSGSITEFGLPPGAQPGFLVTGPDGSVWFTELRAKIGKITPQGLVTEFSLI